MFIVGYNIASKESGVTAGMTVAVNVRGREAEFLVRGGPSWAGQVRCLVEDLFRWYMGEEYPGPISVHLPDDPGTPRSETRGSFLIEAVPAKFRHDLPWLLGPVLEELRKARRKGKAAELQIIARPLNGQDPGYYCTGAQGLTTQLGVKVEVKRQQLKIVKEDQEASQEGPHETA